MAGAGYKLFNTGDVLTAAQVNTYLQEQAVMRFANAAARTTALSGVLAEGMMSYLDDTNSVEVYNGSAWVSVSSDQTPLTTKGDLFTYSTTDARLGVGNNGENLIADSSATTGLRWTATPSASNPVLNGGFDIWQRGTSFSIAASTNNSYTADRWTMACGANQAMTISRQATSDTTNLPNIQYCLRFQRNSGQTGTGAVYIAQSFESVNSIYFAGKTITLSFYARAGANYSASSSAFSANIATGTGTDQNRITGPYTGDSMSTTNVTLTTTWQRFSYTITAATNITELAIFFNYTPTGTAGAADYFEVTGVQLDIGSVALPFRRAMNTLAGELAACQRYYYRQSEGNTYGTYGTGGIRNTTTAYVFVPFPVTMRIPPTSMDTNLIQIEDYSGTAYSSGSFTLESSAQQKNCGFVRYTHGSAALTQYRPAILAANASTSAYIGFSAEL